MDWLKYNMAFFSYIGTDTEHLAGLLCEQLRTTENRSFFTKDHIIVQTKGMEQYLNLKIAELNGISTLIEYSYIQKFLCRMLFGDKKNSTNHFSRNYLTWYIIKHLPELIKSDNNSIFRDVANYIYPNQPNFQNAISSSNHKKDTWNSENKNTFGINSCSNDIDKDIHLLQLAEKTALIFDKYLNYRPDGILFWEGKNIESPPVGFETDSWQKKLWLVIKEDIGQKHLPEKAYQILTDSFKMDKNSIPERAFIFGISTLPHLYIKLLVKLSEFMDIHLYYRTVGKPANIQKISDCSSKLFFPEKADNYFGWGVDADQLIRVNGKNSIDFLTVLKNETDISSLDSKHTPHRYNINDDYIINSTDDKTSLLYKLKNRILYKTNSCSEEKTLIEENDSSIQFHSFYNPMREIEALHNFILKSIDDSVGKIKPADIVVMAPNIQEYSSYIEAVFNDRSDRNLYIYSTVADKNISLSYPEAEVFIKLLKLCKSRFKVNDILDVINCSAVYLKLGFTESDLELLRKWLSECAVNWGIDDIHRGSELHEDNSFYQNSWITGLRRMLLGYTLKPDVNSNPINSLYCPSEDIPEILPYDEIEGNNAIMLGSFISFMERLFDINSYIKSSRKPEKWCHYLINILDDFFEKTVETADGIDALYEAVSLMDEELTECCLKESVNFDFIINFLKNRISEQAGGSRFFRGGVTFCSFSPMRSIPAKIICMLGMNDGVFPRVHSELGFDLMKKTNRFLDPSVKDDDRYLFLEGIMSTRDTLYISFIGRDAKKNSLKHPSPVVTELLDYIDDNFTFKDDNEKIITEHPLHSFDLKYFSDIGFSDRLFSYSKDDCKAARSIVELINRDKDISRMKIGDGLNLNLDSDFSLDSNILTNFFKNSCKYIINKQLNINLEIRNRNELSDCEMLGLNNLEKYYVQQEILAQTSFPYIDRKELFDNSMRVLNAKGIIPHPVVADTDIRESIPSVEVFLDRIKEFTLSEKPEQYSGTIDIDNDDIKSIFINSVSLYKSGQLFYRFGRERAINIINAWINHLFLNCSSYSGCRETFLICWDKKKKSCIVTAFSEIEHEEALDYIRTITELYIKGLENPLPFFPETLKKYSTSYYNSKESEDKAMSTAYSQAIGSVWNSDSYRNIPGESEDVYFRACFGKELPSIEDLHELYEVFYLPILENSKDTKTATKI